jgi:hypothetical protein
MSFIKVKAADRSHPEVLQNWQLTLNGFKLLRLHLTKFGFSKFSARVFNQDALENFFWTGSSAWGSKHQPNGCCFWALL